ncbi:MAG: Fic family protein [Candidatus Omnitrophica bacterium]|nr:Fic family protein [Candidatus Omnitrophota bacterium]
MDVLVQTLRQFRQDETSLKQSWFSWFSGAALRRNQSQQAQLTSKIKSAQDSLLKLESELFNQRRILRQSIQAQRGLPSALSRPIYLSVEGLAEPEKEIYRRAFASGILESGKPLLHEDFRELQTWVTESDFTESIHKGRAGLNTGDRGVYRTDEVDIPVAPAHEVPAQMDRFLEWLNQTESTITPENVFSFAAEAYIRFIEIHPFKDGNGRTGRQLINLLLMRSGQQPVDLRLVNLSPEIAGFLEFLPDDAAFLGGLLLEASKGKSTLDRLRYGGRSKQDGKNAALAPAQAASIDAWDFLNWMRGQILWGLSGQKQIEDNLHKTKLTREQYAEFMKILEAALRKTRGSEQKKRTAASIVQHFRRQAETFAFLESPRSELRNSSWKPYFTPEKLRGYDRVIVVDTSEGELSHPLLKAWFFFPNGIRDIFPNPKTKIQVKSQLLTIVNPGEKFEFIRSFPDDIRQDEKVLVIVLQGDWFITGSRYPKLMVRPTFIKVLDKAVDIITPRKYSAGKAFLDQAHDLRLLGIPSEVMPGEPNHLRPQDLSPEVIRERERLTALAQRQSPEFGAKSRVVVVNPLFGAGAYRENGKEFFLRAVKKILKDDPSVYVVINEGPPSWAWGMVSEFESMSEFAETPRQKIEQFYGAIPEEHAGRVLKLGTSASGTNDLHRVAALMTLTENVVLLAENSGLAHLGDWMRVPMVVTRKKLFEHYFLDRLDSVVPSTPDEAAAEILRMLGPQTVKSELRSAVQDTVIIEPSEPADVEKLARLLGGKLGRRTAEIVMNRIDEASLEREASASASKAGASGREDRLSRETQSIRNRLVDLLEEERRDGKPHAGLQSIYNHLKQRESNLSDHDKVLFSVLESAVPADPLSRQKPPAETTNWDLFESNLRIYSEGIKGIVYDLLMISLGLEALSESVRRDACKVCPHSTSIVNRVVSDFIQTDLGEEAKVSTVEAVVGADPRMRERGTAARHLWTEIVSPENGPRFYVSLVDSQFEGFGFDTTTDGRVTGKINVFRFSSPEERTSMLKARGIDLSGFIEDSRFIEDRLGSLSRLHDLLAQLVKSQAREDEIAPQSRDRWDFRYFQLSTMLSLAARFVQSDQSEDTLANARTVLEKAARYHARHKGVLGKAIDLKEIDLLFLKIAIMQTRIPIAAIRDPLITASSLTRIRTAFGGQELPPYLVPVFKDLEAMEEELHGVIAESLELMNRAEMITASAVKGEEEEFLNLKSFIGENDERLQLVKFILLSGDYPEDRRQKIFARLDLQAPEDQDSGAPPRSELRRQAEVGLSAQGKNSGDATALSEDQLDLLVNYLARSGGIGVQIDIQGNGELFELVIALYREDAEALERNVLARVYVRNAEAVASLRSRLAQGETYAQRFAVGFVMPEGLNMDAVTQRAFFQGYAQGLSAGAGEVLFGGALPESLRQALQRLQADVKVRAGLGAKAQRAMTLLGNEQATVPVATLGTSAEGFKAAYFPLMLGGDAALAAIQDDPEKARLLGEITARSQIHLANLLKDPTTKLTAIEIKAALLKAMHLEGLAAESFFEVTGQGLSLNAGKLGDLAAEMKTSMLVGSSA